MFDEQSTSSASDAQPEKLVPRETPSPPASSIPPQPGADKTGPTQTTQTPAPPGNPRPPYQPITPHRPATLSAGKSRSLWQRDPAYRVLLAGIVLALIVVIGLLSSAFAQLPTLFGGAQTASATPQGTLDARPAFPTPGGQGSTQSSQPPKSGIPTVTLLPTATAAPGGALTVQISGALPPVVNNNTTVNVGTATNQAGATVQLFVIYTVPPGLYTSPQEITDANGNATLLWSVRVLSRGQPITARLDVTARSQGGQQAVSAPITVQIIGAGTGG